MYFQIDTMNRIPDNSSLINENIVLKIHNFFGILLVISQYIKATMKVIIIKYQEVKDENGIEIVCRFLLPFVWLFVERMHALFYPTNQCITDGCTDSTNCPKIGQYFEYENDTISVTYSFWEMNGTIEMLIRNKLNQPIYIDWKKCSFITGETKHDYWDGTTDHDNQWFCIYNT